MPTETSKKKTTRKRKKKTKSTNTAEAKPEEAPTAEAAQPKQVDVDQVRAAADASDEGTAASNGAKSKRTTKTRRRKKKIAARTPEPDAPAEQQVPADPPPVVEKPPATNHDNDDEFAQGLDLQEPEKPAAPEAKSPPAAKDQSDDRPAAESKARSGRRRGRRKRSEPAAKAGAEKPNDKPSGAPDRQRGPARADDRAGDSRAPGKSGAKALSDADQKPSRTPAGKPSPTSTDLDVDRKAPIKLDAKKRTMLVNVSAGDECRIAIVRENRLEELFIERVSSQSHVGNIYKGRVTNVESGIQAAFIDFGLAKNGFLHISDVQPQYFPGYKGELEEVGRKTPRRDRPSIQDCFRRGQEVIVQVIKDGVGTKGPTLTTYLSIPGRYLVMMPGMNRHGVSRKVEDEDERRKARDVLNELDLPQHKGFIVRTAGVGQPKRELQRDLNYLLRLWKTVVERVKDQPGPAELYRESDLIIRTLRDVYSTDFSRIIIDDPESARKAKEFLGIIMPRTKVRVDLYSEREPIFHRYGVEEEIERINQREVPLRSGGSLVIDSTEALVAIDVNSGKFRSRENAEETAYKINMEAADEIARQLLLRDLGGLIVCDFIDMVQDRHKRAVERKLRDALKTHKERARILRMSAFGLIEMTRQRRGPSIKRNMYFECRHCGGSGLVKMPESVVLDVMRNVQLAAHNERVQRATVTVSDDVAYQILNRKRAILTQIEAETGKEIMVRGDSSFTGDQVEYYWEDGRGQPVPVVRGRPTNGG